MPHKKNKHCPTSKAAVNSAERKAAAQQSADGIVDSTGVDVQVVAIECIDEMLAEMSVLLSPLQTMGMLEPIKEHIAAFAGLQHIQYCLRLTGPLAIVVTEALDKCTHEQYFHNAGLGALYKNCLRVIQDFIAMCMIRDPETFDKVMDMSIEINTRSKLRHSHFIMKRYLRDVGQHLLRIGIEEPAVGVPGQAGSSTDALQGNAPASLDTLQGSAPASLGTPPGLSMPQTTAVHDLLEEALVELRPVLDNLSAAGFRAKQEATYALNHCIAGWRTKAAAGAPGGADYSAEVWIRSVVEPREEQNAGEQEQRALIVAILFDVSPILLMLAGDDEAVNSAIYFNILKEYVHIQVPSAEQIQVLGLKVLQAEPWYSNVAGYSALVRLPGHLFAGTAVIKHEQWAQKTGLFEDPTESLLSRAIRVMVGAGWWHRHHWHNAKSVDFLLEVLVALNHIFKGATSLGKYEKQILALAHWFMHDYDHVSTTLDQARTLLSLARLRTRS
jgi:hypothetical protein